VKDLKQAGMYLVYMNAVFSHSPTNSLHHMKGDSIVRYQG
jgi:hypothetical protein